MCLPKSVKNKIKSKIEQRNTGMILASQLMRVFSNTFFYATQMYYRSLVRQGFYLGLTEEEWMMRFLGPNGEIPNLYRAFSYTGYTSSEEEDDDNISS